MNPAILNRRGIVRSAGCFPAGASFGFAKDVAVRTAWLAFLAWGCLGLVSAAPLSSYRSYFWDRDDGLPRNNVQVVVQTLDGYIWLAAHEKLVRFDGTDFLDVPCDLSGKSGLLWIGDLWAGRDGSLWVGLGGGEIARLRNGQWTGYTRPSNIANDVALEIYEDRRGTVWAGSRDGLWRLENGRFVRVMLANETVHDFDEDKAGNLWVATSVGLLCLTNGNTEIFSNITERFKSAETRRSDARTVCCSRDGSVWTSSLNEGVIHLKDGKAVFLTEADGLPDKAVRVITEDSRGNVWVGAFGGLLRWNGSRFVPMKNEGEPYLTVSDVFEDREGNIWVGSKAGLSRLNPKQFEAWTTRDGLAHNNILSLMEDRNGTLWIATWGGGLQSLRDGQWTTFSSVNTPAIRSDLILSLCEGSDGALWFGTDYNGGLYRMKDGAVTRFSTVDGLPARAVRTIYEDRHGRLWAGTSAGLHYFQTNGFVRVPTQAGLLGEDIRCLIEDQRGEFWAGTEAGLFRRRGQTDVFDRAEGIPSKLILGFYEDSEGDLWIGTGSGLARIRGGRIHWWGADQGMSGEAIYDILEDERGTLWFSTSQGVAKVKKKDFEEVASGSKKHVSRVVYGKSDGLGSVVGVGAAKPAACRTRDGRLWFINIKGIAVTHPDWEAGRNQTPPPVYVRELLSDRNPVKLPVVVHAGNPEALAKPPGMIELPPGRGELEFHYAALSFTAPERNRFRFKLEGADAGWVDGGNRRFATYYNLRPGRYTFRVQASNNDGVWNEDGASLAVVLLPFYWQTAWFRTAMALAVLLAAGGFVWNYTARRRGIERLRMQIASDLHDEVGSSISCISMLARKIGREGSLAAAQQEDLANIGRIAAESAASIRDIVWFIHPEYDTMQDLLLRMRDTADTLLSGIPHEFHRPQEGLSVRLPLVFRRNIFLMYREILGNILKHSHASRVVIRITGGRHAWSLEITDNGAGFDPHSPKTGNGLKNLRARAERLKGNLEIESRPGRGTRVAFSVKHIKTR